MIDNPRMKIAFNIQVLALEWQSQGPFKEDIVGTIVADRC